MGWAIKTSIVSDLRVMPESKFSVISVSLRGS